MPQQNLQASADQPQCATPAESCSAAGGDNACTFRNLQARCLVQKTDTMRTELLISKTGTANERYPHAMAKLQTELDEERVATHDLELQQLTVLGARLRFRTKRTLIYTVVDAYNKLLMMESRQHEERDNGIQGLEQRLAVLTQELETERESARGWTKLYPSVKAGELFYG